MKLLAVGKGIKKMIAIGAVLSMLSVPVFAGVADTGQAYEVPEFSVVIGSSVFAMDWANDSANEAVLQNAIVNNTKGIYVQTFKGTWFDNSTGEEVGALELQGLEATSFNGVDMDSTPIELPAENGDNTDNPVPQILFYGFTDEEVIQLNESRKFTVNAVGFDNNETSISYELDGVHVADWVSRGSEILDTSNTGYHVITLDIVNNRTKAVNKYELHYTVEKSINSDLGVWVDGLPVGNLIPQNMVTRITLGVNGESGVVVSGKVSIDGKEIKNYSIKDMETTHFQLDTKELGVHLLRITSSDAKGNIGDEKIIEYTVFEGDVIEYPYGFYVGGYEDGIPYINKNQGYVVEPWLYSGDEFGVTVKSSIDGRPTKTGFVGEPIELDTATLGLHTLMIECIDSLGVSIEVKNLTYQVIEEEASIDETTLDYALNFLSSAFYLYGPGFEYEDTDCQYTINIPPSQIRDTGTLEFRQQVIDTLTMNGIKPVSITTDENKGDGYVYFKVTMPSPLVSDEVVIKIDGLYLDSDKSVKSDLIIQGSVWGAFTKM